MAMNDLALFRDMLNYAVAVCRKQGAHDDSAMEDARYEAKEVLLHPDLAAARSVMDDEHFKSFVKRKVRNAARRAGYQWSKNHSAPFVRVGAMLIQNGVIGHPSAIPGAHRRSKSVEAQTVSFLSRPVFREDDGDYRATSSGRLVPRMNCDQMRVRIDEALTNGVGNKTGAQLTARMRRKFHNNPSVLALLPRLRRKSKKSA
jgi:hypothetical protein